LQVWVDGQQTGYGDFTLVAAVAEDDLAPLHGDA
jgi:hypothetical protein